MILKLFLLCLVILAVFFYLPVLLAMITQSDKKLFRPSTTSKVGYRALKKRKPRKGE